MAVVLLAFLRSWRAALVTFVAIPLSLLAAALGLWGAGFTINTMTLGGFAVALGVLVDDAIIGVENVMRRLRGRDLSAAQRLDVVLDASLEVRSPMIYATIVVLLVFVPVMLLPGVEGRLVEPLSWAFVLSVLASLVVALIVTPALAAMRSNRTLLAASAATLVVIALVLLMAFERRRHAVLVLMNVPFALIGALGALLVLRLPLSLGAAVGLATVFGISARNAILLLSHFEQLSLELPGQPASAVAWRAAEERLVPVLMTALVAGLGLLPLAFGLGRAGHEIEAPLAIVVLGGLVSSTLLSLILVPALAGGAGPGRQLAP